MAGAHPHVFADVTPIAVFDRSGFVGLKNHWVFDEMYSAAILASADAFEAELVHRTVERMSIQKRM